MSMRSAGFLAFFLCAAALIVLLVFQSVGTVPTPAPARGPEKPPAAGTLATGDGARALAQAVNQPAAAGAPEKPAAPPAPPVDPLMDPPLTDDEKARGVTLVPGGGRVDFKNRTLILPAEVCLRQGPIELFACAEGGKDHESVLRVRCRPELVNLNLTLFNLRKGPSRPPDGGTPGDRVIILCEWEEGGRTKTVRAEDLIWNVATDRPMDRVGWTYVGSKFVPEHDVETGKPTGRTVFAAVYGRTLIATFLDSSAIFETPLPEGVDDTTFTANEKAVPPRGTAVRMIVRPPTAEEQEEIRKVEAAVDEQRKARKPHGVRREEAGGDRPQAPAKPEAAPDGKPN